MKFVVMDETQGATTSDGAALTPDLQAKACQVMTVFLNRDVAPFWGDPGGSDLVRAASSPTDIEPDELPAHVTPQLSNAPGAIAYHTVNGVGMPDIEDGITLSDTLFGPGGWTVAMTHELAETRADPATNTLRADNKGKLFAQEVGDPVEVQSYPITIGADGSLIEPANPTPGLHDDGSFTAYVSNFVTDAYFTPDHPGPYDFMTATGRQDPSAGPAAPFTIAFGNGGNYQIWEPDSQQEQQATAMAARATLDLEEQHGRVFVKGTLVKRLLKKRHVSSRAYRRGLRMAA